MRAIYIYLFLFILIFSSCVSKKDKFISDLEATVEYVSQNKASLTSETLEVYNSKVIALKENEFSIYRSKMTIDEIKEVNLLFGKYDALIIQINMNEVKNKLKDGLSQGTNMLKELFAK